MTQNNVKKLKIAITGGYASGKSSVLTRFFERGFKTYSADTIYKDLLKNEEFVLKICEILGVPPQKIDGKLTLNKKAVSNLVFNNKEKLNKLNSFTHNRVYEVINDIYRSSIDSKLVFEIPLLFESGKEGDFDIVIVVMKNTEERAKCGAERDNISIDEAYLRIKNQYNYDNVSKSEHTLIYNDDSVEELYAKVDRVIEDIERKIS